MLCFAAQQTGAWRKDLLLPRSPGINTNNPAHLALCVANPVVKAFSEEQLSAIERNVSDFRTFALRRVRRHYEGPSFNHSSEQTHMVPSYKPSNAEKTKWQYDETIHRHMTACPGGLTSLGGQSSGNMANPGHAASKHIHTHTHTHKRTHVHTRSHTHTHPHTHTHTHTHTHRWQCWQTRWAVQLLPAPTTQ
jgi:hypothetical protein